MNSLGNDKKTLQEKINVLNDRADTLCLHKDPAGTRLAWEALQLSRSIGYELGIGEACHCIGLTKFRRQNDSALYYFTRAVAAYKIMYPGYEKNAFALNNLSRVYYELQQFDSALLYGWNALKFVQQARADHDVRNRWCMFTYGAIANAHEGLTHYDSASYYTLKAARLAEEQHDDKMLGVYYKALSGISATLGNYQEGVQYAEKSILYTKNDCRELTISLANLGSMYSRLGQYDLADSIAKSSLRAGEKCNVWNSAGSNYTTLGKSQYFKKEYSKALQLYQTGIKLAVRYHNSNGRIGSLYRHLGEVYEMMDSIPQAKGNYLKALELAEGDNETKNALYLSLSAVAYKEGDARAAYAYLKNYLTFRDTVYSREKIRVITELHTKYETEKKDQQLLILQKDRELKEALLGRQLQQLAKEKAEKREQELELINYHLENDKQAQLLHIQELDIENDRIRQQEQSAMLVSTQVRLKNEVKEKQLAQTDAANKRNWLIFSISGFVVLTVISYLLFNRYRLLKTIQNQNALLKQREHISRELHDEIGATLSGIAMYSHLAKEQLNKSDANAIESSLYVIQQNAREMVTRLNDIIWLINPVADSLERMMQRLEEYGTEMAATINAGFRINHLGTLSAINFPIAHRRNIYLIFKEAINNAVKYSGATMLELDVTLQQERIVFALTDNGYGFDISTGKKGNGLVNMQQRATEVGAQFTINTCVESGTSVTLQYKIPQKGRENI